MGTTSKGIVYPDKSGVPNRDAMQALAETANAAIHRVEMLVGGQKRQRGVFVLTVGTTPATIEVLFPEPFSSAAAVHIGQVLDTAAPADARMSCRWGTSTDGGTSVGTLADSTPTGFWFRAQRASGSANIRVRWEAIGPA